MFSPVLKHSVYLSGKTEAGSSYLIHAMFSICHFSSRKKQAEVVQCLTPAVRTLVKEIKRNPPSEGCMFELILKRKTNIINTARCVTQAVPAVLLKHNFSKDIF